MSYQQHFEVISHLNDQFRYEKSIESLFELDQWSALPSEGGPYRQQMAAHVAAQKASLFAGEDARRAAEYFSAVPLGEVVDFIQRGLIRTFLARYRSAVNAPPELVRQYNLLKADVMNQWKLARAKQDFGVFAPWLEQVFSLKKQIAQAIDPARPAFDTLLDMTDAGLRSADVSREFEVLKGGIQALMGRIAASGMKPDGTLLAQEEQPEAMAAFARRLAQEAGYDVAKGGFNHRVVHGFTSFLGPQDGRISTPLHGGVHLIFTCLHEAGHAMYATGGSPSVNAANMWGGIEGSFHEANARFYENMVGRSHAYWEWYYPQLQQAFPRFSGVPLEEFYRALHTVRPSLRRIEADEVTYSLHAILRFELERDWFAGELSTKDMAEAWNQKYDQMLGIRPANDTEGVLQDMHWAGDYIGYFQSYALGNIYDGQILQAVEQDLPDLSVRLARGDFRPLDDWMTENLRQYGCCFTAGELMEKLTGSALDAQPFLRYLNRKYAALYAL